MEVVCVWCWCIVELLVYFYVLGIELVFGLVIYDEYGGFVVDYVVCYFCLGLFVYWLWYGGG